MAVLTLLDAQLAFGHVALLDHADFSLEVGERVGLIGRNGAGKSSLLKILAGLEKPDDGSLQVQAGRAVVYVAQEPILDLNATIFEAVQAGLAGFFSKIYPCPSYPSRARLHTEEITANTARWLCVPWGNGQILVDTSGVYAGRGALNWQR